MTLDDCGTAHAALNDIGIDCTLEQIFRADLLCFVLKDADEFLADDLALALGLANALKLLRKRSLASTSMTLRPISLR